MRPNLTHTCLPTAQPAVGSVPQPDDESDVICVGTAPCIRLSLVSSLQFPILTL